VIVLVIIGFPITFFLSWNYDIKPDSKLESGEINPEETTHPKAIQTEKSDLNIYTLTGGALAVIGIIFWFFFSTSSLSMAEEDLIENSIAVFEFENLSEESETSRMGEILQHLIISDLSGLTHLKVISHQRLQDIQKQTSEGIANYTIAQQANAKVLLSGSIMDKGSDQLILLGELIDAINGNVIISHRIEGTDLYSMVDKLTENIRQDLDISKHEDDQLALEAGTKTTQSLEAYDKYLEGVKLFNQIEWADAREKFEEAVAIDSTFFVAYYYLGLAQWWDKTDMDSNNPSGDATLKLILDKKIYNDELEKLAAEGAFNVINDNNDIALPIYKKLIEKEPDNKLHWYGIGEAYYHQGLDDPYYRESNYPKALSSMQQVLELDPEFHVALYHMFDVWEYNENWGKIINWIEEHDNEIPDYFRSHMIRAYENNKQSSKARKYYDNIAKEFIKTDPSGLCLLSFETAFQLGNNNGLFNEAMYYAEKAVEICPLDSNFVEMPYFVMPYVIYIALANELGGLEKSKDAFYKSTKKFDPEQKVDILYRLIRSGASAIEHDATKFNLDFEWFIPYLDILVEISTKHRLTKDYTKAMFLTAIILGPTPDKAAEKIRTSLSKHCPSGINTDCFTIHEKSVKLFHLLYNWGEYGLANEIGQFLINVSNKALAENLLNDKETKEFIEELSYIHYLQGLIKLKKGYFDNARKDFYNALSTITKDEPDIEPWKIKSKIAECYFNNNDYSNAIKKYRKNYYDTSWETNWKYANLSMLALSEFRAGQIDSAKIHFNLVEKTYSNIDHDEDPIYYYTDWPLYQYYDANGNAKKALKYLDYAHDNIPDDHQS
jgi:tetratricopeptide (TPR) repeat protein